MNLFKRLFADTAVYGLGSIVPRLFNFFLVPLHTRVFGPEAYGDITDAYGWMAILNVVFLFGMETAYLRFASKPGHQEEDVFRIGQTVVVSLSVLISGLLLLTWSTDALSVTFGGPRLLLYASLTLVIDAVCALPFARLRLQNRSKEFALAKILNVVVLMALNIWFLTFDEPMTENVFLANLIANALYLLFFFRVLLRWRPKWHPAVSPAMFSYAWPIMLTGLAGMTNEMFSRISIDNWLPEGFYDGKSSDHIQGIFGACYKFAMLMSLVVQAFRMAAEPFFFTHADKKDSPALFARVNHLFTLVSSFFLAAICLNMNWLRYFIDEAYWSGLVIVPLLLAGYAYLGIYYNISVWFKVTDRTGFGTMITAFGAILTITLNFVFIPLLGILGSALVTFICYFSMTMICYFLGRIFYPVPYTMVKDTGLVALGFGIAAAAMWWNPLEGSTAVAVGLAATLTLAWGAWKLAERDFRNAIP